jgi:hypothetical protein
MWGPQIKTWQIEFGKKNRTSESCWLNSEIIILYLNFYFFNYKKTENIFVLFTFGDCEQLKRRADQYLLF